MAVFRTNLKVNMILRHFSSNFDSIIRVDHAGELGADRIYAGQMFVLGKTKLGPLIDEMWKQEMRHKETFESLIRKYRVRPTVMTPIWNVGGFLLGKFERKSRFTFSKMCNLDKCFQTKFK